MYTLVDMIKRTYCLHLQGHFSSEDGNSTFLQNIAINSMSLPASKPRRRSSSSSSSKPIYGQQYKFNSFCVLDYLLTLVTEHNVRTKNQYVTFLRLDADVLEAFFPVSGTLGPLLSANTDASFRMLPAN